MAGAGYKLFQTGDVLTAAQVNTYLNEQTVMVFASSAARTSALTSVLAEGMVSYLQDTNAVEVYDGSAWVSIGASGDITGVTAGTGISGGGTSGTVTITNDMATTITAAGDIVIGTGSGTYDNLPIGTTGQVLTADTTVSPYKVKWANAAGGGKVLQVVQTTKTDSFSTNSTTWTDITGMSASITPSSSSSKVLVIVNCGIIGCSNDWAIQLKILRGSTAIISNTSGGSSDTNDAWHASGALSPANNRIVAGAHMTYLDSPATTSSTTYKIQMLSGDSGTTGYLNRWALNSDLGGVSMITLLEIGA